MGIPLELAQESEQCKAREEEIYPDNMESVGVFCDMSTQWRVGMSGATGLDYAALPAVLNIRKVKDRADVFDCLQIMERAVLAEMKKD
jgi:hypothetical protein